jgi:hypothetical protein
MTHDPIELVAQTFYAAECMGEWHTEPEALRERFRDLARTAIATLNQQITATRSAKTLPRPLRWERSTQSRSGPDLMPRQRLAQ